MINSIPFLPYTGEQAQCSKCGNIGAETEWKSPEWGHHTTTEKQESKGMFGRKKIDYINVVHIERIHPELLLRSCNRCGFQWGEKTIDGSSDKPE